MGAPAGRRCRPSRRPGPGRRSAAAWSRRRSRPRPGCRARGRRSLHGTAGAPTSVTTAAARGNSGVQPTLVTVVTSTSPASQLGALAGVGEHPDVPSTTPAEPGKPGDPVPAAGPRPCRPRRTGRCDGSGRPPRRTGRTGPRMSRRIGRQGAIGLVRRPGRRDLVRVSCARRRARRPALSEVQKNTSSPRPVSSAGAQREGAQHPEVADDLAARPLPVAGDGGPALQLAADRARGHRVLVGQPLPGRVPGGVLVARSGRDSSPPGPAGRAARSIQSGSSPGRGVAISNSCGPRWAYVAVERRPGRSGRPPAAPARRAVRGWRARRSARRGRR